jgi:hypothetical protein
MTIHAMTMWFSNISMMIGTRIGTPTGRKMSLAYPQEDKKWQQVKKACNSRCTRGKSTLLDLKVD